MGPEPHGVDDRGREVLSFLPGETITHHPWPRWIWSDFLLVEAAQALSAYHRAVDDFQPALVESRLGAGPLGDGEIVCHNDFAPYNCVFDSGHLTGIIDWDVVCPGPPSWDLAFFAWQWVPLHAPSPELAWRTPLECQRRLRLVLESYELAERVDFVNQIERRIEASRSGILTRAAAGDPAFVRLRAEGHADEMALSIDYVHSVRALLDVAMFDADE